jgi:hypothetical protein
MLAHADVCRWGRATTPELRVATPELGRLAQNYKVASRGLKVCVEAEGEVPEKEGGVARKVLAVGLLRALGRNLIVDYLGVCISPFKFVRGCGFNATVEDVVRRIVHLKTREPVFPGLGVTVSATTPENTALESSEMMPDSSIMRMPRHIETKKEKEKDKMTRGSGAREWDKTGYVAEALNAGELGEGREEVDDDDEGAAATRPRIAQRATPLMPTPPPATSSMRGLQHGEDHKFLEQYNALTKYTVEGQAVEPVEALEEGREAKMEEEEENSDKLAALIREHELKETTLKRY